MQRSKLVADSLLKKAGCAVMWNIEEALGWLSGLEFFGIKLGLDQTRELFRRVGSPERTLRFIHIAGSNGKGSTGALTEAALRGASFRTGFYSSPHLVDVNERFLINGVPVGNEALARALASVRSAAEAMKNDGMHITYFEATTATAALLFAEAGTDFVVWETGMGGRLDATSVVTPAASVITTISLEHKQYLGDTLAKIAFEKAGIIKPGVPLFLGISIPPEAYEVIAARAKELNAPVTQVTRVPERSGLLLENGIPYQICEGIKLRLLGKHQRGNLMLAREVVRYLAGKFSFDFQKAAEGFSDASWNARFQVFPEENMILDGGHNPECSQVLAETLREIYPGEKFDVIYGSFADKDSKEFLQTILPLTASFSFVRIESDRPSRLPSELTDIVHGMNPDVPCRPTDLHTVLTEKMPHRKLLCGSLHLCGEALALRRNVSYRSTKY